MVLPTSKEQTVSLSIHPLKTSRPPFSIATSRETDAFLAGQLFSSYKHLEMQETTTWGNNPYSMTSQQRR